MLGVLSTGESVLGFSSELCGFHVSFSVLTSTVVLVVSISDNSNSRITSASLPPLTTSVQIHRKV